MAEMDTSSGGGHKKGPGVKKGKKLSTRVDLTPMVDLGFLLITFFIFTTTMSQPTAMKLFLPKDVDKPDEQNKLKESAAFTVMPSKADKIYYYEGLDPSKLQASDFKGIRDIILDKKRRTDPKDFMVMIKPSLDSNCKNSATSMGEIPIDGVKLYSLVDFRPAAFKFVTATETAN